jgi:hypothetical protein
VQSFASAINLWVHVSLSGKWSWSTVTLASLFGQDRPAESPALKAPDAEDLLFSDLHISKKLAKLLRLSEVSDRVKDRCMYVCMYVCIKLLYTNFRILITFQSASCFHMYIPSLHIDKSYIYEYM